MNVGTVKWPEILGPEQRSGLGSLLLEYARERRWFRSKTREARGAEVISVIPLQGDNVDKVDNVLVVIRIAYAAGEADLYAIPLARVENVDSRITEAAPTEPAAPADVIARLGPDGSEGVVVDGLTRPGLAAEALLRLVVDGGTRSDPTGGSVRGEAVSPLDELRAAPLPPAKPGGLEQTNSTIMFGERALLKVYRHLVAGPNPELEMGRYLTAHADATSVPRVLGALTFEAPDGTAFSLGVVHQFLPNDGDALSAALSELRLYFGRISGQPPQAAPQSAMGTAAAVKRALASETPAAAEGVGRFGSLAVTLGRRTGQLHLALARAGQDQPDFVAEPMANDERRQLSARAEAMFTAQLEALSNARARLSPGAQELVEELLSAQARESIANKLARFAEGELIITKMRTHGDLHLGQVLVHGDDFIIIDFEGEPGRPLEQRRAKSSPLRDVMGMVRSLAYAPEILLRDAAFMSEAGAARDRLQPWSAQWSTEVTVAYLRGYLSTVTQAAFVPPTPVDLLTVLTFYELEKVIYEVTYELNNRPAWVEIPLRGLVEIARQRNSDARGKAPDDRGARNEDQEAIR